MAEDERGVEKLWRGDDYEVNTAHHRRHDPPFLSPLDVAAGAAVLDVGCGDGSLTARLAAESPEAEFLGIDAAPDMIATAGRRAEDNLRFEQRRAQDIDFSAEFDVVLSVAALHWVPAGDHPGFLTGCRDALRPGGRLLLEFGGQGNVTQTLRAIADVASSRPFRAALGDVGVPWYFPSADAYGSLVRDAGFVDVEAVLVSQPRIFTRGEFEGWLVSQTLLPWLALLDDEQRPAFIADVIAAASRAARSAERYLETFVRVQLQAQARVPGPP